MWHKPGLILPAAVHPLASNKSSLAVRSTMNLDRNTIKRPRSPSTTPSSTSSIWSPSSSRSASPSLSPAPKYHRPSPSSSHNTYLCSLPPTCSQPEAYTSYATLAELERHQASFHQWVCRTPVRIRDGQTASSASNAGVSTQNEAEEAQSGWVECSKAFPDDRLLSLVSAQWILRVDQTCSHRNSDD